MKEGWSQLATTIWQESLAGESLVNLFFSSIWRKKFWQINRSAKRLLIISTYLDGFSLVNHKGFTKFAKPSPAKLSRYMVYHEVKMSPVFDMRSHPKYYTSQANDALTDLLLCVGRLLVTVAMDSEFDAALGKYIS